MLAYAQITQLMALPCYNGDWKANFENGIIKYSIIRRRGEINKDSFSDCYFALSFKSSEARDAFYENHMDLLRDYFQLD